MAIITQSFLDNAAVKRIESVRYGLAQMHFRHIPVAHEKHRK
jgi:hypothetical protein